MKARILVVTVALVLITGATAGAQTAARRNPFARAPEPTPLASIIRSAPAGDSLANGAIIGAFVGAGAAFGFGWTLCNALREPGNPSCWKGSLLIAAVGAGGGALAGAGIDALIDRGPALRFAIRF